MNEPFHIENFEIIDRLGVGGMATVWKARQSSLDRLVAIKVLAPHFASDPADIERFRAEACAAGRLKHPGIVQVYDANFKDGIYYFVMELVDGYTVGEWIRRKGRLPESDALVIAENVASALDYAWSSFGIIHRDIKPENVMVDADGSLKITDLGLARAISSMQARTVEQEVLGTPAYMSPEQVTGQSDLDCRADMYALGATLYHMVTGHLLFADENSADDIMQKQMVACVPNPAREVPELSRPFVRLIGRLLAKDRAHRPADWKAVLEDIRRVRRGMLPAGGEPSPGASTIFLNAEESDTVRHRALAAPAPQRPVRDALMALLTLLVIAIAVGVAVWFLIGRIRAQRTVVPPAAVPAVPAVATVVAPRAVSLPVSLPVPPPRMVERHDEPVLPPAVSPPAATPVVRPAMPSPAAIAPPPAHLSADEGVRRLARTLLHKGLPAASQHLADLSRKQPSLTDQPDYAAFSVLITQALAAQQSVLDSFLASAGKSVTVSLLKGPITGVVGDLGEDGVHLKLADGTERVLTVDDLDVPERLHRLGHADHPGALLLKGIWACRSHATSRARDIFLGLPSPLGVVLIHAMDE